MRLNDYEVRTNESAQTDDQRDNLQGSAKGKLRAIYSSVQHPERPLLVLLHGYGSNEHDLPGLADALSVPLDYVSLQAPHQIMPPMDAYAWFFDPVPQREKRIAQAENCAQMVLDWLTSEESAGKIDANRKLILLGFSQGGAMVSYLLASRFLERKGDITTDRVIAGVQLSGYLPFAEPDFPNTCDAPLFHGFGDVDDIVPLDENLRAKEYFAKHFPDSESHIYQGLAHGINLEEVYDIRRFLEGVL